MAVLAPRSPRRLLVQGARPLPELRGPPHGEHRGARRRSHHPRGTRAPMGALASVRRARGGGLRRAVSVGGGPSVRDRAARASPQIRPRRRNRSKRVRGDHLRAALRQQSCSRPPPRPAKPRCSPPSAPSARESQSSRPPSRSPRPSPPAPKSRSRAASSAPSPRLSMTKATRRSSPAVRAAPSTKTATTSKQASASTPKAILRVSTYFDIALAHPSPSAASSHYPQTRSDIASRNFAMAAPSSV